MIPSQNLKCANLKFVPYDAEISPTDNLYNNPNDLDTQPEYPLRNDLKFYEQVDQIIVPPLDFDVDAEAGFKSEVVASAEKYPFPPASTMLTFWFMGLALWCVFFANSAGRKARRKKASGFKDV
jgi:hypothetical protein